MLNELTSPQASAPATAPYLRPAGNLFWHVMRAHAPSTRAMAIDLFQASCPPPFQGQHRFALLFKFAPGEFVSHEHTYNAPARRDYVHGCTYVVKTGVESDHLANSCYMRVNLE